MNFSFYPYFYLAASHNKVFQKWVGQKTMAHKSDQSGWSLISLEDMFFYPTRIKNNQLGLQLEAELDVSD